jgi:hypothetical protein
VILSPLRHCVVDAAKLFFIVSRNGEQVNRLFSRQRTVPFELRTMNFVQLGAYLSEASKQEYFQYLNQMCKMFLTFCFASASGFERTNLGDFLRISPNSLLAVSSRTQPHNNKQNGSTQEISPYGC